MGEGASAFIMMISGISVISQHSRGVLFPSSSIDDVEVGEKIFYRYRRCM